MEPKGKREWWTNEKNTPGRMRENEKENKPTHMKTASLYERKWKPMKV